MNDQNLDTYESSLLTELRQVVAENGAADDRRRPSVVRRRSLAAVLTGAAAAMVAGVLVVTLLGGSPAYAIEETDGGDIVITIHDLKDSEQLERDLADHGITAEVDYDPELVDKHGGIEFRDDSGPAAPDPGELPDDPVGEYGVESEAGDIPDEALDEAQERAIEEYAEGGTAVEGDEGTALPEEFDDPCGFGSSETPLVHTDTSGDDYVITIPADSVLTDHTLRISVSDQLVAEDGGLVLITSFSPSDGTVCGEVSMTE